MESIVLFPFSEYWWVYGVFTLFVLGILALDLGVFHKTAHEVSFKEAAVWSVVWVAMSAVVGWILWQYAGYSLAQPDMAAKLAAIGETSQQAANRIGMEYTAGYIIEKALAVDNVFVWAMIFSYWAGTAK